MKGTGSFEEVKLPERDVDYPPQSSAEVKGRVELYLYSTAGLPWPVLVWNFAFFFMKATLREAHLPETRITVQIISTEQSADILEIWASICSVLSEWQYL